MKHSRSAGLVAGLLSLALAGPAVAAPVTLNLRIEGPTRTLFEGPVRTDVRPFKFTDEGTTHRCDGTAANKGTSPTPVPTRGAAVAAASQQAPFTTTGTWFDSLGSPSFETIDGESVAYDPATNKYLAEYNNWVAASNGSCGDPVQTGDEVLFAYSDGIEPLLRLTGPRTAKPDAGVTVKVVDGTTGAPIPGAAIGTATTGADGSVTLPGWSDRGNHGLKATKSGTVRSNRLRVCVTNGRDGLCDAPDRTRPVARIAKPHDGTRYAHAPRTLRGTVSADPSGIRAVQLRLKGRSGRDCRAFDGRRERFTARSCYRNGKWFTVGDRQKWSYLLPSRLGGGRYTLDVRATDKAGNRSRLKRGASRVVFTVR